MSARVGADLWRAQGEWVQNQDRDVVKLLISDIHNLRKNFDQSIRVIQFASTIQRDATSYGMNDADVRAFLHPMLSDENPSISEFAMAAMGAIEARQTPFEFVAPTLDGEEFDVNEFKGKVVLVDHWATTCSACIDAMPRLHDIYERYNEEGFEVVSIAYDGTAQRRRIERIEKELGLTWTTLDGEGQWEEISNKYGYQGFPQYMLLNRDGTHYAGTGEINMGRNLEALLEEMLAAEAAEKAAATIH